MAKYTTTTNDAEVNIRENPDDQFADSSDSVRLALIWTLLKTLDSKIDAIAPKSQGVVKGEPEQTTRDADRGYGD